MAPAQWKRVSGSSSCASTLSAMIAPCFTTAVWRPFSPVRLAVVIAAYRFALSSPWRASWNNAGMTLCSISLRRPPALYDSEHSALAQIFLVLSLLSSEDASLIKTHTTSSSTSCDRHALSVIKFSSADAQMRFVSMLSERNSAIITSPEAPPSSNTLRSKPSKHDKLQSARAQSCLIPSDVDRASAMSTGTTPIFSSCTRIFMLEVKLHSATAHCGLASSARLRVTSVCTTPFSNRISCASSWHDKFVSTAAHIAFSFRSGRSARRIITSTQPSSSMRAWLPACMLRCCSEAAQYSRVSAFCASARASSGPRPPSSTMRAPMASSHARLNSVTEQRLLMLSSSLLASASNAGRAFISMILLCVSTWHSKLQSATAQRWRVSISDFSDRSSSACTAPWSRMRARTAPSQLERLSSAAVAFLRRVSSSERVSSITIGMQPSLTIRTRNGL
mmetsp:Transcript_112276/g.272690  ORF Transcript_112276/g.272690 Transcript_112276/m.272690 type:complete len:449 (+) Transcript_112276:630-1976(+)